MFSYHEKDGHTPIAVQRKFAHTRRVDKLMVGLQRHEYAVYKKDESTVKLVKLMDLIIYALEMSLPDKDWNSIRGKLIKVRNTLTSVCPKMKNRNSSRTNRPITKTPTLPFS